MHHQEGADSALCHECDKVMMRLSHVWFVFRYVAKVDMLFVFTIKKRLRGAEIWQKKKTTAKNNGKKKTSWDEDIDIFDMKFRFSISKSAPETISEVI